MCNSLLIFLCSSSMSLYLQEGETLSGVDHEEDTRSANKQYLIIAMGSTDFKHFEIPFFYV